MFVKRSFSALRQGLSILEENAVTSAVGGSFEMLYAAFLWWCRSQLLALGSLADIDVALVWYFDSLFLDGEPAALASKIVAAVGHHHPEAGRWGWHRLPRARRAAQGWRRLAPATTPAPLPWLGVLAMIGTACAQGNLEFGLFLLLTFVLYLRPAEALNLTAGQLVPPLTHHGNVMSSWGVVLGPASLGRPTKIGEFDQHVMLDREDRVGLHPLLVKLHALPAAHRVWTFISKQALLWFKTLARDLHIPLGSQSLYVLRHGGVSADMLGRRRSLADIKKRGRWMQDNSLRRYEKAARALQELEKIPAVIRRYGSLVEQNLVEFLTRSKRAPNPPKL